MPVFGPNVTETESYKFLLEWATPSYSNILEHSLIYKQVKVIYHSNTSTVTYFKLCIFCSHYENFFELNSSY